jgi:hypothetical protein
MAKLSTEEIKKLKVAKIKCEESLLFFTRYFFKIIHKRKFVVGDHHKIICEALERVMRGECKRLIINISPRFGKTELAVINFISYALALNPSANFMHLSYSDDLVLDNSEKIREIIESPEYKQLFGNVTLKKDSKAKKKWKTDAGGSLYVASAAGQVTGFGAGKVDLEEEDLIEDIIENNEVIDDFISRIDDKKGFNGAIILDDPIKPEDADYTTRRDKVNQRFDSTIRNRVNSRNTPIIIIMQLLHPEDLCGYLLEQEPDEWEVIKLPVIWDENSIKIAHKYVPALSQIKVGMPLWPFKMNLEEIEKERKKARLKGSTYFETQFMQDPQPKEGLCFAKKDLQYLDNIGFENIMQMPGIEIFYGDTADEGEDNYSMPMGKIINGKVYVHDVIFTRDNLTAVEPRIIVKVSEYGPIKLFIEANNAGALHMRDLRKNIPLYQSLLLREKKRDNIKIVNTQVHGIKNTANKLIRIISQEGFIKERFVFRAEFDTNGEYGRFMKQIWQYLRNGKEKRDDAPDSIAGLAYVSRTFFGTLFN